MTTGARIRFALLGAALLVGAVGGGLAIRYLAGGSVTPPGQPRLVSLDSDRLVPVRERFNESPDESRLLLLFSPT